LRKFTFLIFLFLTNLCFSQNYNWITPNKTYLKLFIFKDGICRINKNDFIQAGVQVNFDPRTVKVFQKGAQIPIYFEGESDGIFNDSDFFDFYGTRNYGGLTNTYKESNGTLVVDYVTDEYYNLYSDTNVYWVGWDGIQGLRVGISTYTITNPYPNNYHYSKQHFENDLIYSLGETLNPNADFRYFNNEKVSGEGWFWKELRSSNGFSVSDTFQVSNLFNSPQTCTFRVFAYPNSKDTTFNEHRLILKINSTTVATIARNDYQRFDTTVTFSSSALSGTSNNIITSTYSPSFGNTGAVPSLYFDLMEINYPVNFSFSSGYLKIITAETDTASKLFKITGFNNTNPVTIYDITNNLKIVSYSSNGDTLFFTGKGNSKFEVFNKEITSKPFRIEPRQVPDLVSGANGADYIVIYNRLFSSQAEDLRQHRQNFDNFRAVKTDVSDVIDIFNYGIEDPAAIRHFAGYVYNNWQTPKVKYICLFGRGSLDPKNNKQTGTYFKNLIPVYGNPLTDGYFANFNHGTFTYIHNVSIGRLPAYTQQEAQDIVNKIISYDNQPPDHWWKTFIMITGGSNRYEQEQYQLQSNEFINSYLKFPPLSVSAHKIYRNDSAGYVTYNFKDSIKNEINRGGLVVNFIGHAGSQDWEVGMEDPSTLSNGNKLPLVLSMTCFTGRNAETSYRSFGEKFIYLPNKCAIGFVGSSGWSFSGPGNNYNGFIFQALSLDSMRRIGDLQKYATVKMAPDSQSFAVKNTLNCYSLLGDPATKLLIPLIPEFSITPADYTISNQYPSVNEVVTLTIYPKNFGTYADSCKARFQILKNSQNYRQSDTILRNFAYLDTAVYRFRLDTLGNYSIKITLDPDNWYPNEKKFNNSITFQLPLRNISLIPLKPIHNSVITEDSVEISGLNPQVNPAQNSVRLILQIDTSVNFTQPVYSTAVNGFNGVVTKFRYRIPFQDSNIVYHWRTNTIINNDSTGWTAYNNFVYNPQVRNSYKARLLADSNVTIYTRLPGQFSGSEINNLFYTGSGFELNNFAGNLTVRSYGSNGNEASYFIINNYTLFIDGGSNPGLNIIKLSRLTGKLIEFRNFRLPVAQSNDTLLAFLNTFDTTQFIMLGNASYVPCVPLSASVKAKIRSFGSRFVDSVLSVGAFDTWAFIGYLGANPNNTSEQYHNYSSNNIWTPSFANMTPVFLSTAGSLTFNMGPAHRWKYFSWNEVLYPNSSIKFDVIGIKQTGDSSLLFQNLTFNTLVNIDTLSSYNYPFMYLKAKVAIDTLLGLRSPLFHSLTFKYTPPAEIIPDNYSFVKSDSIVQEGQEVTIYVKNYNAGYVPAKIIINKWSAASPSGIKVLKIDTTFTPLYPDSSRMSSVTFSTEGLRHREKTVDTVSVFFETSISGNENDYYSFNNFALTNIVVTGDSLGPSIDVTYDGQKIINGDLIPAKPEIIYKFYDDSKIDYTLSDTQNVRILLDNLPIRYFIGGLKNQEIDFNPVNNQNLKIIITYHPTLAEGPHELKYIGGDQNGNFADTLTHNIYVSYGFNIRNLYNYPNPMKNDTYFTFDFFSDKNPPDCRIKIYTVAGRLIKEIKAPVKVGFNQIYWDGRDNDGEYMANGIYLYKVILEDASRIETSIQKLAILK
jgi:hypothetical protein